MTGAEMYTTDQAVITFWSLFAVLAIGYVGQKVYGWCAARKTREGRS